MAALRRTLAGNGQLLRSRGTAGRFAQDAFFGRPSRWEPLPHAVRNGAASGGWSPPAKQNHVTAKVVVNKSGLGPNISLSLTVEQSNDGGATWFPLGGTSTPDVLEAGDLSVKITEQLYRGDVFAGKGWAAAHDLDGGTYTYHQLALCPDVRVTVTTSAPVAYSVEQTVGRLAAPPIPLGQQSASLLGTFTGAETGGNVTVTTGSRTTTSGSLITAHTACGSFGGGGDLTGISAATDSKSNTYTEPGGADFVFKTNRRIGISYNSAGTRGASHTVTCSWTLTGASSGGFGTGTACEWGGVAASPAVDVNSATGTSTSPAAAVTPSGGPALVVGIASYDGGTAGDIDVTNGTLAIEQDPNNDTQAQSVGYKVASGGSTAIGWTTDGSTDWGALVVAFTEAVAPASPSSPSSPRSSAPSSSSARSSPSSPRSSAGSSPRSSSSVRPSSPSAAQSPSPSSPPPSPSSSPGVSPGQGLSSSPPSSSSRPSPLSSPSSSPAVSSPASSPSSARSSATQSASSAPSSAVPSSSSLAPSASPSASASFFVSSARSSSPSQAPSPPAGSSVPSSASPGSSSPPGASALASSSPVASSSPSQGRSPSASPGVPAVSSGGSPAGSAAPSSGSPGAPPSSSAVFSAAPSSSASPGAAGSSFFVSSSVSPAVSPAPSPSPGAASPSSSRGSVSVSPSPAPSVSPAPPGSSSPFFVSSSSASASPTPAAPGVIIVDAYEFEATVDFADFRRVTTDAPRLP